MFDPQDLANWATVVAAVVAITAIIVGYFQFYQSQKLSKKTLELQISTFADEQYLRFSNQIDDCDFGKIPGKDDPRVWKFRALLATTESVYRLTRGDKYWLETVKAMLNQQRKFLESTGVSKNTFAPEFMNYVKSVIPNAKLD